MFRLQGREFSASLQALLDEGRNGSEAPGTMAAAQGRIAETLAVVEAAAAEGIAVDPASGISHALPIGMVLDVSAERYARDWALPQFYFHVVTAYAILRAQGIALGKAIIPRTCSHICGCLGPEPTSTYAERSIARNVAL